MSILQFLLAYLACGYATSVLVGIARKRIRAAGLTPKPAVALQFFLWPIALVGALRCIAEFPKAAAK